MNCCPYLIRDFRTYIKQVIENLGLSPFGQRQFSNQTVGILTKQVVMINSATAREAIGF